MDSPKLEQKFLDNDKDVVEFTAGSQSYSLSFPGKQRLCSGSLGLQFCAFQNKSSIIIMSFSPLRHDTNKQAVRHKEACEKTAPVCLCSRCPNKESEVRHPRSTMFFPLMFYTLKNILFNPPDQKTNPSLLSDHRRPLGQANFAAIPDHWDKTQVPQTGYRVL